MAVDDEWTKCSDKLPPRMTWVSVKSKGWVSSPQYRKRSIYGRKWVTSGSYYTEMLPDDEWKSE